MNKSFFAKNQIKYWSGLVLVSITLVVIAWSAISSFHDAQVTEIKLDSKNHIQFFSDIIHEKLQDKNYTSVETLLPHWGEQYDLHVAEVTLIMANGFILGEYHSKENPAHKLLFSTTIPYSYKGSADLHLVVDLTSIYTRTRHLINVFGIIIVISTLILAFMMWLFIRKHSLAIELTNRSQLLTKAVAELKSEISAVVPHFKWT